MRAFSLLLLRLLSGVRQRKRVLWRINTTDLKDDAMPKDVDSTFYERADLHIRLSNDQLQQVKSRGEVSASMMYGTARFNAWVSACGCESREQMTEAREETLQYFCEQYRLMMEENLDDYILNFSQYMGDASGGA